MLLSLLGLTTTRYGALALFDLNRSNLDYPGTNHFDIGTVFASMAEVGRWRWEYHKRFTFSLVSRSIRAHLRRNNYPTLLSFGATHKNGVWRCKHIAVVVGATNELIELLDPLGRVPRTHTKANVWLRAANGSQSIRVIGSSYSVNPRSEVGVFRWSAETLA